MHPREAVVERPGQDGGTLSEARPIKALLVEDNRQETIVVVEDDDAVRHLVSRILKKSGFEVVAKSLGSDAISYFERNGAAVDLLLTDVVMPEMSGKVLADRIWSMDPSMKVLFMSGYTDDIIAKRGILESGRQLINKPFDGAQLVSRVREILSERKVS
jgi:DNA-binding response OmpR family regulator